MKLQNPILPGFYPDPSICRMGDDFYLVTSSFEYVPGIPVFHSRDMVHWRQIGHALTRPEQLEMKGLRPSRGIYASTIRYREADGLFYVVTTLVGNAPYWENINFFVTARDPAGPWSDPVIVDGAEGIDPTLFFEGEKVYYLGNLRPQPDDQQNHERHIWLQEIDPASGKPLGERTILLRDGAVTGAGTPEGPHIYHIGDWYYLLIAEGGTSHDHAVSVFRSRSLTGPYEGNPRNPVLTHRMMRRSCPINSTGHADLIELPNGEWWAVLLASRPVGGDYRNLGRETFAVPVSWEAEWPVFSPDTGRVEFAYEAPALPECRWMAATGFDGFDAPKPGLAWNWLRSPGEAPFDLTERPGFLRLRLNRHRLTELNTPAFVGRRQQHMHFSAETVMEFTPDANAACGMTMFMNNAYHLTMLHECRDGRQCVSVYRCFDGEKTCLGSIPVQADRLYLKIEAHEQAYRFCVAETPEGWHDIAGAVDGRLLSKEVAGGFTGAYVGLYGFDACETHTADFDWFNYREIQP